jgi:hypothetical protein
MSVDCIVADDNPLLDFISISLSREVTFLIRPLFYCRRGGLKEGTTVIEFHNKIQIQNSLLI